MALPTRPQMRANWMRTTPWEDNPEFFDDMRSRLDTVLARAKRDGKIGPKERARIQHARRQGNLANYLEPIIAKRKASAGEIAPDFNQSAFDLMFGILQEYGLESLGDRLKELIVGGVEDQASLTLSLQDTDEWKQRFAGNEALKKNGLPVLSVAEYLATERAMSQVMRQHGLPEGFYDDPADFAKFIGNSVSPSEVEERVRSWSDLATRGTDPAIRDQLRAMGMGDGDLTAYFMDPERAAPLIQQKYKTALIGASARRAGLTTDTAYAERLAGMGITEQQAQAGYALISENLDATTRLGDIYGDGYNQRDFESEVFQGDGNATRKRKRLASQERASFSGQSGVAQGSLRQSSAGQF